MRASPLGMRLFPRPAAVVSGSWTPASLPGLKLWVENDPATIFKDAGTTLAVAGTDTIQQWNDKSGNANHVSQSTAGNRPSYATASGKSYALFNGTGTVLNNAANFTATDGTGQHYVAVACYFDSNSTNQVIAEIRGTTNFSWVYNGTGAAITSSWNNAASSTDDTGNAITAATPVVLIYTVTPSALEVFVDNATNGSTALTGTRASSSASLYLGTSPDTGFPASGRIYGAVVGSGTLSSTDRASLQAYMAALHP